MGSGESHVGGAVINRMQGSLHPNVTSEPAGGLVSPGLGNKPLHGVREVYPGCPGHYAEGGDLVRDKQRERTAVRGMNPTAGIQVRGKADQET